MAGRRERIEIAEAMEITGLTARTLRERAALGEIPGAAKPFGRWTFNEAELRAFTQQGVKKCEKRNCRRTAIGAAASSGRRSRSKARYTDLPSEQVILEWRQRVFGSSPKEKQRG